MTVVATRTLHFVDNVFHVDFALQGGAGPFTVDVNWDDSTTETLTVTDGGTLTHAYAPHDYLIDYDGGAHQVSMTLHAAGEPDQTLPVILLPVPTLGVDVVLTNSIYSTYRDSPPGIGYATALDYGLHWGETNQFFSVVNLGTGVTDVEYDWYFSRINGGLFNGNPYDPWGPPDQVTTAARVDHVWGVHPPGTGARNRNSVGWWGHGFITAPNIQDGPSIDSAAGNIRVHFEL